MIVRKIAVLVAALIGTHAFARPLLQPEVKEYAAVSGAMFIVKDLPVIHTAGASLAAAAGEVRAEGPKSVYAGEELPKKGVFIAQRDSDLGRLLVKRYALSVPDKKQGYAIKAADGAVAIVGHDEIGAFYGAETFRQMAASGSVEPATVRDWPDILYRGAASAGRGLWQYTEGERDRLPMMKAALDELARMKMNVIGDHFWLHYDSDEKLFAFWREVNRYAAERGIFANDYGSTAVYLRYNYPKGKTFDESWPCVRHHVSWEDMYYCWADDSLTEQAANNYADYVIRAGMEKGILVIHPVDDGFWQNPEDWSRRCAKCRARWNDHERWKASVNQFNIWARVLRKRLPEALIGSCIYPYKFGALMTPEAERSAKWKESMPEYWQKLSENMEDRKFFFSSWICPGVVMRKIREILPKRPFHFSDTYPRTSGIFHAFNRKACTVWEPQSENIFCTQGLDMNGKWESLALISECTWNKDAPCAEIYDGGTYYDPIVDHKGDTLVFTEALPRICATFWGERLAPCMTQVMGSGVMPDYILDPPVHIKYWNSTRRNSLFDPTVKQVDVGKAKVKPIDDTPELMGAQVKAAEVCVKALVAAEENAKALPPVQRRYFMKLAKGAPYWLATARVKYNVRRANELVGRGENAAALDLLKTAREEATADFDRAAATMKRLAKEPDACGFRYKWGFDAEDAKKLIDRAEASAKVVMEPRKIGRYVKLGIVKAGPYVGVKKYFDRFENVKAEVFDNLSLATLDAYDCVIILDKAYDKDEFFANLKTYVEKGAGGVYIEGALCGSKRWDEKTPFPEVVETSPEHIENFGQNMKFADGRVGKTMYVDFFSLRPGAKGDVRAYGPDGKSPLAVRGEAGLGKVFFNGTFSIRSVGGTYAVDEKAELSDANAVLVREAVEYFTNVRLKGKDE